MWPVIIDKRQAMLTKIILDLSKLKSAAESAKFDNLSLLLANAQNVAQSQLATPESEIGSR